MITQNLTAEQEQWLLTQLKPAPEVFVLAYAGTSWKEWKLVSMCSHEEFLKVRNWEERACAMYPSALLVKVYISNRAGQRTENPHE